MEVFRQNHFIPSSSSSTSSLASPSSLRHGHAEPGNPSAPAPVEFEHMFDKVVTPSDVGKLNRLVIPKQYAERYFPLDPLIADKGILLCFEDRAGKRWQFRYSYWNSSQSYVMTKGWSRFVKDKQLDSGDTVSFSRATGESGHCRLFIDWHRRLQILRRLPLPAPQFSAAARSMARWVRLFPSTTVPFMYSADASHLGQYGGGRLYCYYQSMPRPPQARVQVGAGMAGVPSVLETAPLPRRMAEPKRVRLFGVDLECSETEGRGETSRELQKTSLQWRIGAAPECNIVSTGGMSQPNTNLRIAFNEEDRKR